MIMTCEIPSGNCTKYVKKTTFGEDSFVSSPECVCFFHTVYVLILCNQH